MRLIEIAKIASYAAGKFLLNHLEDLKDIKTKSNEFDFVTQFDRGSEEIFFTLLEKYFPDIPFLSEETGKTWEKETDRFWIIDPLDGTTNYVNGIPIFTTSLALIEGGKPILGVIYDPMREELFWAEKGKGAFVNNKPIHISTHDSINRAVLSTTFSYTLDMRRKNSKYFDYLYNYAQAIRTLGSCALSLAYTAMGRFDAFWTFSVSLWDVAAGAIILEEAGGKYVPLSVDAKDFVSLFRYNTIGFLGSNPYLFSQMYDILKVPPKKV